MLTDLGDLVAGTQAGQRQRRILARADDQVEAGRLVRQEERNQLMHREVPDHVIVVQDQQQPGTGGGEIVDQGGQQLLRGRGRREVRWQRVPTRSSARLRAAIR